MGNRMNALTSARAEVFIHSLPLRERLIWRIGSQTGLRLTDILNLYKKDVLSGKWTTRERKTGKRKRCRVDKETIMLARAYMKTYKTPHKKKLFINMRTNKPFTRQNTWKNVKKIAKKHNLRKIAPHSTRKTFAQELLKAGYDVAYIQKQLNHAKEETTQIYLKNTKGR